MPINIYSELPEHLEDSPFTKHVNQHCCSLEILKKILICLAFIQLYYDYKVSTFLGKHQVQINVKIWKLILTFILPPVIQRQFLFRVILLCFSLLIFKLVKYTHSLLASTKQWRLPQIRGLPFINPPLA